jgi:hypothetical protein
LNINNNHSIIFYTTEYYTHHYEHIIIRTAIAYSAISLMTTKIPKNVKKEVYFTHPSCVKTNIELLRPHNRPNKNIRTLVRLWRIHNGTRRVSAFAYNRRKQATIYQSVSRLSGDKVRIVNADYLTHEPAEKYDLLSETTYFVMKKTTSTCSPRIYGRPFIYFVYHTVHTATGGRRYKFRPAKEFPLLRQNPKMRHRSWDTVYSWLRERQDIEETRLYW